jgi:hypothetical protein
MPCGDNRIELENNIEYLKKRLDKISYFLCEVMKFIGDDLYEINKNNLPLELKDWWEQHKKWDNERTENEKN